MPLPTVKPMISRSPLPATSSTRRRLHHPTMDAREFHRSAFSTKPILPGSRTGTTGGGDAGGRGDDLGALELGLVLLDALLDVRHDVVGTRPGDETRGARGGSDARGGGDAEGRAREAAGGGKRGGNIEVSASRSVAGEDGAARGGDRRGPLSSTLFRRRGGAETRAGTTRGGGEEYAPAASGHRGGADRRGGDGHGGHCACVRPRRLRVRVCGARRHPAGALGEVEERPAVDGMTCRAEKIFTI